MFGTCNGHTNRYENTDLFCNLHHLTVSFLPFRNNAKQKHSGSAGRHFQPVFATSKIVNTYLPARQNRKEMPWLERQ